MRAVIGNGYDGRLFGGVFTEHRRDIRKNIQCPARIKAQVEYEIFLTLFGKPYRDIKMGELVNVQNGKGLEVTVEFKIGKDLYTITNPSWIIWKWLHKSGTAS